MKSKELRGMSKEELQSKILELKKDLMKLNTQVSTGTNVKESGQIKKIKKTIARILTIIKSKEVSTKHE